MTQEIDPTREIPEFRLQTVDDSVEGKYFTISGDPEQRRFRYESGNDTSRKTARKQAEERETELRLLAAKKTAEPDESAAESSPPPEWKQPEKPELSTPAPQEGVGPGEEPEMARQHDGPASEPAEQREPPRGGSNDSARRTLAVLLVAVIALAAIIALWLWPGFLNGDTVPLEEIEEEVGVEDYTSYEIWVRADGEPFDGVITLTAEEGFSYQINNDDPDRGFEFDLSVHAGFAGEVRMPNGSYIVQSDDYESQSVLLTEDDDVITVSLVSSDGSQEISSDVDLEDPSTYVVEEGVDTIEEAQAVAGKLGLGSIASCRFLTKDEVAHLQNSGVMTTWGEVQYRRPDGTLAYSEDQLAAEDYFLCYTEGRVSIWLQAKCGNHVKMPPPPKKDKPEEFWIPLVAEVPAYGACPDGSYSRRFVGRAESSMFVTADSHREAFIEAYFSQDYLELAREARAKVKDRVQQYEKYLEKYDKCKKPDKPHHDPDPPVIIVVPQPTPQPPTTFYGTGSATWSVTTGDLCEPHGQQAASSGTVTVSQSHLYGRTLATITSTVSQADANAKAKAIAEAEADEIEEEKSDEWEDNENHTCDTQSQPSWADDRLRADTDEDDEDDHGSYDEDDFTVEDSDEPDRDPPSEDDVEDDYDDPVQGENPEPRDDDDEEGYDEPEPPPPSHSDKPTNPNGALW